MRRVWWIVGVLVVVAAGFGYEHWRPGSFARLAGHDIEPAHAQAPPSASRGPRATAVATAVATKGDLALARRAIGWVQPLAVVNLKPRVDGELVTQHATDGQDVKAGQILFTSMTAPPRPSSPRTRRRWPRTSRPRCAPRAISTRQLLAEEVRGPSRRSTRPSPTPRPPMPVAADQADLDTDRLNLSYTNIKSPIDGRLGAVQVTPGNLVKGNDIEHHPRHHHPDEAGARQLLAARQRPRRAPRRAPSGRRPRCGSSQAAARPIATGTLDFVDSTIDTATATINASATVANEDLALWPGEYVDIEIPIGIVRDTALMPSVSSSPARRAPSFSW